MNVRDLIPWGRELVPWGRQESRAPAVAREERANPLLSLHREVNRLFDDAFRGWGLPSFGLASQWNWPSLELRETDREVRVAAEVPGLSERDIDLSIDDGVLTIRGERKEEASEMERGYSERYYGRFERRLALPSGIDEDKATARFENGLLTVTLPKTPGAEHGRHIPINAETKH